MRLFRIYLLICLFSTNFLFAQTAPSNIVCSKSLSFEDFLAIGLSQNLEMAEIDKKYAQGLAVAIEMEVLGNPEFSYEKTFTKMQLNGDNDPQTNIALGQPLKLSDFGSKSKVAELIRKSESVDKKSRLLEFSLKLGLQYYKLQSLQDIRKIISDAEARAAKKVILINEGVKKGLFSTGEENLFEGEKFRLQAEKKGIDANILSLQQEINKGLGLKCLINPTSSKKFEALPSVNILLTNAQKSGLSEVNKLSILDQLTLESQKLVKLEKYQITPKFLYQHTNDGGDFYGAGITIPLPLWDRNQAQQQRVDAERIVVEEKMKLFSEDGLAIQIENYRNVAENLREQAEIFSSKVVPSFEAALSSQERLYSEGKGNILQVWQTLRALNEVQIQSLMIRQNLIASRTELSIFIGENL